MCETGAIARARKAWSSTVLPPTIFPSCRWEMVKREDRPYATFFCALHTTTARRV